MPCLVLPLIKSYPSVTQMQRHFYLQLLCFADIIVSNLLRKKGACLCCFEQSVHRSILHFYITESDKAISLYYPEVHFHLHSDFPISATQFIQNQTGVLLYVIM